MPAQTSDRMQTAEDIRFYHHLQTVHGLLVSVEGMHEDADAALELIHGLLARLWDADGNPIDPQPDVELCRQVQDVQDGDYGEQNPWTVCNLPKGHTGPHTEVDVMEIDG